MSQRLLIVLVVAVGGAVIVLLTHRGRDRNEEPPARPTAHHDWDDERVSVASSLFPDGEWWGMTDAWTVLMRVKDGCGHAAIATGTSDLVLGVRLVAPVGRLVNTEVVVSDATYAGTWTLRVPDDERPPGASRWWVPENPADDVLDRFVVDNIFGFGHDQAPFVLFRSECRDPLVAVAVRRTVFERLREMVEGAGKDRG